MTIDFSAIVARSGQVAKGPLELRSCPDQYVGMLCELERLGKITTRAPASERPHRPALIIVLESPHTSEFDGDPAPAKGPTGRNLAQFLREVIGLNASIDLPVILVNAVQYQCSLSHSTSVCRDKIFHAVWTLNGKACFQRRLRKIFEAGDAVACLCTKGDRVPWLRLEVVAAMEEALPGVSIQRRTHPASWSRGARNRTPEDWRQPAPRLRVR